MLFRLSTGLCNCGQPLSERVFFFFFFLVGFHSGKFNLGELYERIGFSKEIISRGKFAEMNADQRSFRWGHHRVSSVELT